jgi:sialidase-1
MLPHVFPQNAVISFLLSALVFLCSCGPGPEEPLFNQLELFRHGEDGYHTYRIPAQITTQKGTILAFCEGRTHSSSDTGNIDVVLKRSFDNGETWTSLELVADHGEDTIGNPAPVVDRDSGTILLLMTSNPVTTPEDKILAGEVEGTRRVWITKSTDDGATWSPKVEITESVKEPNWTWYATGPVNGIQLASGRLVIPCDHAVAGSDSIYSHVIYSDDHGRTWKIGGTIDKDTDESTVVELADGSLMINMRSNKKNNRREVATSQDGGLTWSPNKFDSTLIEPVCQASLLRFTQKNGFSKNRLLFSNPAATERVNMAVRLSYDEGETWPVSRLIHEGPSAYSSLVILADKTLGLLYEGGARQRREWIAFARFNLEWLTKGADRLESH